MYTELEEQYDKIYRYCYFKVRKPEVAEDITQETFLSFYLQKSTIGLYEAETFGGWCAAALYLMFQM